MPLLSFIIILEIAFKQPIVSEKILKCFMITDVRLSGKKSNKYLELHWKVSFQLGIENLISVWMGEDSVG